MLVWIVIAYDPVPDIDREKRILRYGRLAQSFRQAGDRVVFWTSTFDHTRKRHRFNDDHIEKVDSNYTVRFLYGPSYKRNWSPARIWHNRVIAEKFTKESRREERPSIIFAGIPCLELVEASVRYGRDHAIPTIVDVQDTWPDVYLGIVPGWFRGFARKLLTLEYRRAAWSCRNAAGVTAVSRAYLNWGLRLAGRPCGHNDAVFYLATKDPFRMSPPLSLEVRRKIHSKYAIPMEGVRAVYLGQFGTSYDVITIIEAAKSDLSAGRNTTYILIGGGDLADEIRERARDLKNVRLLGWLGAVEATAILMECDVGLAAYSRVATQSIPYKPLEYMAAGLPVICSLTGELQELISSEELGAPYQAGDANSLSAAIASICADPYVRAGFARNARQAFSRLFDEDAVYPELVRHLTGIATGSWAENAAEYN